MRQARALLLLGAFSITGSLVSGSVELARAQEVPGAHRLTVRILSETGTPLATATVVVSRAGSEPGAWDDVLRMEAEWGRAEADLPGGGRYRLQARAPGHQERIEIVDISGSLTVRVALALDPYELPPIVARGERGTAAPAVRSLDRVEFRGEGLAYATVGEWLSGVPGATLQTRGAGGRQFLSVRGSRPEEVLVLLDGVPLNDPVTGRADLSGIPTSTLQSASLVRGTASARYGSGATAATLLLTSRAASGSGVGGGIRMGSFGARGLDVQAEVSGRDGRLGVSVAVDRADNDFPYTDLVGDPSDLRSRVNADTRGRHATLQGSTGPFRASLRLDDAEHGLPGRMGTSLFDNARAEDRLRAASVGYRDSRAQMSASFARRDVSYRSDEDAEGSSQTVQELRLTVEGSLPGTPVTIGGRWASEDIAGDGFETGRGRVSAGVTAGAALSAGAVRLDPALSADLAGGEAILSPEVSLTWQPFAGPRFWARLGRGFRSPTFGDLYFQSLYRIRANPELVAERITLDAEVGGAGTRTWKGFAATASVVGWRRTTEDPIVWVPSSVAVWSPRNLGSLEAYGVEMRLGLETLNGRERGWSVELAGTVQRSRVGFGSNRNPLPYQPDASGRFALGAWVEGIGATATIRYTGARTTGLSATRTLPGFFTTGVSAQKYIDTESVHLGLFVKVENLWNQRYQVTELFPEPGRQFSIRIEARRSR